MTLLEYPKVTVFEAMWDCIEAMWDCIEAMWDWSMSDWSMSDWSMSLVDVRLVDVTGRCSHARVDVAMPGSM